MNQLLSKSDIIKRPISDWPRLQRLWGAVARKRQSLLDAMSKAESIEPGTIPADQISRLAGLLLEVLERLHGYAVEQGSDAEREKYAEWIRRIQK